jgi:endonuclease YncB( thermonuclease family)
MSPNLERIADLERLINWIDGAIATAPAWPQWNNGDSFETRQAAQAEHHAGMARIITTLCDQHGARYNGSAASASTLRIAGIQTSCTSGTPGLLRNWQAAARRRIEKLKGATQ